MTLESLDRDDFFRAVKAAARQGKIGGEIEQELERRMITEELGARELYFPLFEAKDLSGQLLQAVINYLEQHSYHASSVLAQAKTLCGLPAPTFVNCDSAERFGFRATVNFQGTTFSSLPCSGPQLKLARQLAEVSLLAKMKGLDWSHYVPPIANGSQVGAGTEPNLRAKNSLQEICQQRRWPLPQYESHFEGRTNARRFFATARVDEPGGKSWTSDQMEARTLKGAELLAAENLLTKLRAGPGSPSD